MHVPIPWLIQTLYHPALGKIIAEIASKMGLETYLISKSNDPFNPELPDLHHHQPQSQLLILDYNSFDLLLHECRAHLTDIYRLYFVMFYVQG